ncbi:23S rRNA (adenine(2030)-N(6))-methyltransferase RlmJ [Marinobacterium sp. AK62]|uniref:Ribosomal RNA large subunit methyltransferase J n=1 Tax=Marinobacterium alkalitolerans TaxID=1542925 RepID=A0ABS3ZC33_9GAMM|nr:23S rRNA (adenine(2030)-N(6))-methyltransferase RlmJ [Marinobacterium alkalitolerans]MBP0049263.1 23S rRNA (adenine(2030)-N(6))-methyltransferase RlmJ [Marinobacterium alkalitolerans]
MLSYQHGYHAGNFADVHKHLVLNLLLQALNRKAKPWSYLETHGGRARYDLEGDQALKTGEYQGGIGRLWHQALPQDAEGYMEQVTRENQDALTCYPGSPLQAAGMAREDDRISIMELHPAEADALKAVFRQDARVAVHHRDGYEGVLSQMPPRPNRGVVLIDPAFEVKKEYQDLVRFITKAYKHWPNGCFAIWYPLLPADLWRKMKQDLKDTGIRKMLCAELEIMPASGERGMYGSGMLVINPPWQLDHTLEALSPWLTERLELEKGQGTWRVEWLVPE